MFQTIKHPFLIELLWSSVDRRNLYLLFPYVAGGELFYHLRSAGRFGLASVRFYSAEIISALSYLHGNNIVYRYIVYRHSGALSLVQILELLSSDWFNLTMLYAGAKVYAITTHLMQ